MKPEPGYTDFYLLKSARIMKKQTCCFTAALPARPHMSTIIWMFFLEVCLLSFPVAVMMQGNSSSCLKAFTFSFLLPSPQSVLLFLETMAEQNTEAKLKNLLKQNKIQLWNPPYTDDNKQPGQQHMEVSSACTLTQLY